MIKTWQQRCEEHPDHNGIVTEQVIRDRMQEEIDDLRQAIEQAEKQEPVIPSGVINAIRNVGLTLIKTQQGYVLQRIEGIKAQTEEKKT